MEILLGALLTAAIFAVLVWASARLLLPPGTLWAVLPASGDGARLEQTYWAWRLLRRMGVLRRPLLLLDLGLDAQGRQIAEALTRLGEPVLLVAAGSLDAYFDTEAALE